MKYFDRKGNVIEKQDRWDSFWNLCYNNPIGRMLIKPFTSPVFSRFVGAVLDSRLSVLLTLPYKFLFSVSMEEYEPKYYESYNAFFTREMKAEYRPVDGEIGSLVAPSDGKLRLYPITEQGTFSIKGSQYTVESLLKSRELARAYEGGTAVVIRLDGEDYHHFCYAASGKKGKSHYLQGVLHPLVPATVGNMPVFKENAREYCRIRTKYFDELIQMEVGAMLVGRIENPVQGIKEVTKGESKGYFSYGGSTTVLLMKKDTVDFDTDLLENSQKEMETQVKMGERIGYKTGEDKSLKFFHI